MIKTGDVAPAGRQGIFPRTLNPGPDRRQALLMAPAERADVIVDFRGLPSGTVIRMINTAPDAPFGGFPDPAVADPTTSGQIMQFRVNSDLTPGERQPHDASPENLVLNNESLSQPRTGPSCRHVTLNESGSQPGLRER